MSKLQGPQINNIQIKFKGLQISQGRLEAPLETTAQVYAFTKDDADAGTSNVVTGQLSVATQNAYVLFDSGATHCFVSYMFPKRIAQHSNRITRTLSVALPSGEMLSTNYWIRHVPIIIAARELYADLVILGMIDYDIIPGMDFLGRYNTNIKC